MLQEQELSFGRVNFPTHMAEMTTTKTPKIAPNGEGVTRNPVWLTLIGLIIGEIVMGIPGMILAPVVLNYVRVEMSKIEVPPAST